MTYTTIISPPELATHLTDPRWIVVDCRFALADTDKGRASYEQEHITGAIYAHLNDDLSGPILPNVTGRHPLPTVESTAQIFGRMGIGSDMQIVAYDDMGGALAAARLWWMLHWLGHKAVAVLDGGWQLWQKKGLPTHQGIETPPLQVFTPQMRPELLVNAEQVDIMRQDRTYQVLDARATDRYQGKNETIDPVAGHIPGAISAPFTNNLTEEGTFRTAKEMKAYYQSLLNNTPTENIAVYCGSGVTAAHDILAICQAGLGDAKLYAGSWSEWITDPKRPVTTKSD